MIPTFHQPVAQIPATEPAESATLVRRFGSRPEQFSFEPSARWVRGIVADVAVVDSRQQFLIWEPRAKVPEYIYPLAHIRTDLLVPSTAPPTPRTFWRPRTTRVEWFDLALGDRRIEHAAWRWLIPGLDDYLTVNWFPGVLDAWYEEDERVHTHPRDPHNRVDAIPSSRHVEVRSESGDLLAETDAPVLVYETELPTRYYIPARDVRFDQLEAIDLSTSCPYKGHTSGYWAIVGEPVAWTYADPAPAVAAVAGHIAFYQDRTRITVDGVPV